MSKTASIRIPARGWGQRLALDIKNKNPSSFVHNPGLGTGGWLVERTDGQPLTIAKSDFDRSDIGLSWLALCELRVNGNITIHNDEKLVIAPIKEG